MRLSFFLFLSPTLSHFFCLLLFFSRLPWRLVLNFLNKFERGGVELSLTVDAIFSERQLSPPHWTYTSKKAKWQWGARQVKRVVLTSRKPPLFRCHRWQEPLPLRARSIYWYCVTQQSNSNLLIFCRQLFRLPTPPPNLTLNQPFVLLRREKDKEKIMFTSQMPLLFSPFLTLSVILNKGNYKLLLPVWYCFLFLFLPPFKVNKRSLFDLSFSDN